MIKPKPASWYDKQLAKDIDRYGEGNYRERNQVIIDWLQDFILDTSKELEWRIFDFAGSGGFLAQRIAHFSLVKSYLHSDFSQVAIDKAKELLSGFDNCEIKLIDIDKEYNTIKWEDFNIFICISFEHIVNDLEIIRLMPAKSQFFFSVVNFEASGHVRIFRSIASIEARYDTLLNFKRVLKFYRKNENGLDNGNRQFLIWAERKEKVID